MGAKTVDEFLKRWSDHLKGATEAMRAGINGVTVAPGTQAAVKKDKLLANFTARVQDGTWGKRVAAVSLAEWQAAAGGEGVNRVSGGVDKAQSKMRSFGEQLIPYTTALKARVASMPDTTLEDRINRATTAIREMSKFRRK